jgi:hypothetical protein
VSTGDPVAGAKLLINDINAHGGVAGRKLQPVFFSFDPDSSTPYATDAQAECSTFTQDHKVFAVIDGTPAADARACLESHGVADLRGKLVLPQLTSNEVDVFATTFDSEFATMVSALADGGWFSPWNRITASPGTTRAKVGIVTVDNPKVLAAVHDVLIPRLQAAGYAPNPADVIAIASPGGFSDDGATVAAIDDAALKLNADGVDHVILTDDNGSLTLLFNNYAYSQNYFPRYGGSTANAWQTLLAAGDIQAKTLEGAIGVGWQPLFDVNYTGGAGPDSNPTRQACLALFSRNGMSPSDASAAGGDAEGCDVAYLLPYVFRGYRGPVNLAAFFQRLDAIGTSYPLASGFSSRFSADHRDGIFGYEDMAFTSSCSCMQYVAPLRSMAR